MPYKRGTNWIAQVRVNEKRKTKIFKTKKEAIYWESNMRDKLETGWSEKTDTVCLGDWAEYYLDYAQTKFSHKTYDEKRSVFKRFFKEVKPELNVKHLNPAIVMKYILNQKKTRSGYAVNKDRKNLLAGWNWGMKYMDPPLPGPNPCLIEKMPEIRMPRYIPPEEDFWKVYNIAGEQDQIMLLMFLYTAARRGEVFKLTWNDIDFINNQLRLKTRKRRDGTEEYNWLPMIKELREPLRWWWEKRPIKQSPYVFLCLDQYAFTYEYFGQPFRERRHFMNRMCQKAGVKKFGFHAIRHLSASILYKRGVDVSIIQAILRHKNPTTTDRYLKSLGDIGLRGAMEKGFSDMTANVLKFPQKFNAQK